MLVKIIQIIYVQELFGIIIAIIFITVFFYTYTGIIGTNYAILDIGSFFVAVFLGEFVSCKKVFFMNNCNNFIAIGVICVLLLCFILFTYFPPKINYFKDPITNNYGILK